MGRARWWDGKKHGWVGGGSGRIRRRRFQSFAVVGMSFSTYARSFPLLLLLLLPRFCFGAQCVSTKFHFDSRRKFVFLRSDEYVVVRDATVWVKGFGCASCVLLKLLW